MIHFDCSELFTLRYRAITFCLHYEIDALFNLRVRAPGPNPCLLKQITACPVFLLLCGVTSWIFTASTYFCRSAVALAMSTWEAAWATWIRFRQSMKGLIVLQDLPDPCVIVRKIFGEVRVLFFPWSRPTEVFEEEVLLSQIKTLVFLGKIRWSNIVQWFLKILIKSALHIERSLISH